MYNCIYCTHFLRGSTVSYIEIALYLYTDTRDTNLLHLNVATPRQAIMNTNMIKETTIDIIIAARAESA